jgi:hypothetical protein
VINICLKYYIYFVGIKEVIDCRNAQSGMLQNNLRQPVHLCGGYLCCFEIY